MTALLAGALTLLPTPQPGAAERESPGDVAPPGSPSRSQIEPNDPSLEKVLKEFGVTGKGVRVVIVSVPTPEQGQFATYFDESLEALNAAAQRAGYALERRYIPWGTADAEQGTRRPRARLPGVLVFGADDGSQLVMLLVTETPVTGIDRGLLDSALAYAARAADCSGEQPAKGVPAIDVLAPYFSGSASSLWAGLRARDGCEFRVITGSATGALRVPDALASRVSFTRTVLEDERTLAFIAEQLANHDLGQEGSRKACAAGSQRGEDAALDVALLAESGTAYGANVARLISPSVHPATPGAGAETPRPSLRADVYRFPLHIAHVRTAHEQAARHRRGDPGLRHTLELSLGEPGPESTDVLPARAPLTPFSAELSLRNTLTEIARKDYRYLLIAATDVADTVFLAREARLYCPSTQLITIGAHVLISHPDLQQVLSGMLVASSYPLIQENQRWRYERTGDPERQGSFESFVNESQQGMFNALIGLLAPTTDERAESSVDLVPAWVKTCENARGPVPWLLEVYGGRLWPLRTGSLGAECKRGGVASASAIAPARPSVLGRALCLTAASLSTCLLIALCLAAAGYGSRVAVLRAFRAPRSALAPSRAIYLGSLSLGVALLGSHILLPFLSGIFGPDSLGFELSVWVGALSGGVLALLGLYHVLRAPWLALRGREAPIREYGAGKLRFAWRWVASSYATIAPFGFAATALGVFAAGARSLNGLWRALSDSSAPMLGIRLADPMGLSPVLPLIMIGGGLIVWAAFGLARVRMVTSFPSVGPFPMTLKLPIATRLNDAYIGRQSPWAERVVFVELAVGALSAVPCVLFWRRLLPAFEWVHFELLLKASCTLLVAAVIVSTIQFVLLCHALAELTRRLVATPMVDAYTRIAAKFSGSFGVRLLSEVPRPEELGVSLRSAEALASLAEGMPTDTGPLGDSIRKAAPLLREAASTLEQQLGEHLYVRGAADPLLPLGRTTDSEPPRLSRWLATDETCSAHEALFSASRRLWRVLEELWRLRAAHPGTAPLQPQNLVTEPELATTPTAALLAAGLPGPVLVFMRMAEDFVAMRNVTFVYQLMRQIRYLMASALLGALLTVLAFLSYPFQPARFLTVLAALLTVIVLLLVVHLILTLERDELLSQISRGTPGAVDFSFDLVRQLALYVGLPSLLLAVRVFPELAEMIGPWLKPLSAVFQ